MPNANENYQSKNAQTTYNRHFRTRVLRRKFINFVDFRQSLEGLDQLFRAAPECQSAFSTNGSRAGL